MGSRDVEELSAFTGRHLEGKPRVGQTEWRNGSEQWCTYISVERCEYYQQAEHFTGQACLDIGENIRPPQRRGRTAEADTLITPIRPTVCI